LKLHEFDGSPAGTSLVLRILAAAERFSVLALSSGSGGGGPYSETERFCVLILATEN